MKQLLLSVSFGVDIKKGLDAYDRGGFATALEEWKPLAEQGNALAQALMGYMYKKGVGVPLNFAEAMKWYRLAAEQGNATAQAILGTMYVSRVGFPNEPVTSYMWWNLAAAQGHKDAAKWRDDVAKVMTPEQVAEAQKLALEWMPKHQKSGPESMALRRSANSQ